MLSIGAFNALLKTLEEPPSYVIFILATTEVHKIPITVLSGVRDTISGGSRWIPLPRLVKGTDRCRGHGGGGQGPAVWARPGTAPCVMH